MKKVNLIVKKNCKKIWTWLSIILPSSVLISACASNTQSISVQPTPTPESNPDPKPIQPTPESVPKPEEGKTISINSDNSSVKNTNLILTNNLIYPSQTLLSDNTVNLEKFSFTEGSMPKEEVKISLISFNDLKGDLKVKIENQKNFNDWKIIEFKDMRSLSNYYTDSSQIVITQNKTADKNFQIYLTKWNATDSTSTRISYLKELIDWNYGLANQISNNGYPAEIFQLDRATSSYDKDYKLVGAHVLNIKYKLNYHYKLKEANNSKIETKVFEGDNKNINYWPTLKINFIPEIESIFNSITPNSEITSSNGFASFYSSLFDRKGILSQHDSSELASAWKHYSIKLIKNANYLGSPNFSDYKSMYPDWLDDWLQVDSKYNENNKKTYQVFFDKKYALKFESIDSPDDAQGTLRVVVRLFKNLNDDVDSENYDEKTSFSKTINLSGFQKWNDNLIGNDGFHLRLKTSNSKGDLYVKDNRQQDTDYTRWKEIFNKLEWNKIFEENNLSTNNKIIDLPFDLSKYNFVSNLGFASSGTMGLLSSNYAFMYKNNYLNLFKNNLPYSISGYPLEWSNLTVTVSGFQFQKINNQSKLILKYSMNFDIPGHKVVADNQTFAIELIQISKGVWDLDVAYQIANAQINKK